MNFPKKAGDDVRGLGEPLESFTKMFVKIGKHDRYYRISPMGGRFWAPGRRILFSTPVQLRKQKYAKEPAQLVLSLKFQSDQHAQMIPYNC